MPIISFRKRTGQTVFAAFINPVNGSFWRVTGGVGNWATYNPATSVASEFAFSCTESPSGSGRYQLASLTDFNDTAKVPNGTSVTVWLITTAGSVTNADITAGGPSFARRWNSITGDLDDAAEYQASLAGGPAAHATLPPGSLPYREFKQITDWYYHDYRPVTEPHTVIFSNEEGLLLVRQGGGSSENPDDGTWALVPIVKGVNFIKVQAISSGGGTTLSANAVLTAAVV